MPGGGLVGRWIGFVEEYAELWCLVGDGGTIVGEAVVAVALAVAARGRRCAE